MVTSSSLSKLMVGFVIASTLILMCSCKVDYTGQYFTYPPGSKEHEHNWQYTLLIIASSHHTPIAEKSKKKVRIKVYNTEKTVFLNDVYEYECASVDAYAVWDTFEEIKLEIREEGNKYADDDYNKQLLKSGPHTLLKATYHYNQEDRKFVRVN